MTALALNIIMNLIVSALLVATIAYCWILSKRIRVLQDAKGELAGLIGHFDESTKRASESIVALQGASKKIGEAMQARIDKGGYIADDLSLMIDRATKLADSMEAGMAVQRGKDKFAGEAPAAARETPSRELPQREPRETKSREAEPARPALRAKPAAAPEEDIEAMLERISSRVNAAQDKLEKPLPRATATTAPARPRTPAEQELLRALEKKA